MKKDANKVNFQKHSNVEVNRYSQSIFTKIEDIKTVWNELLEEDWKDESLKALQGKVESFFNLSNSLGFTNISNVANKLSELLESIAKSGKSPTKEQQIKFCRYLKAIKLVSVATNHRISRNEEKENIASESFHKDEQKKLIFLVVKEQDLANDLKKQIGQFGYTVRIFTQLTRLKEAAKETSLTAIIMDNVFIGEDFAGEEIIVEIQQERHTQIPVLFISTNNDLISRLEAVRAGGNAYFVKPLDIDRMINWLDRLTKSPESEPYRILIVEDEENLANYYAEILNKAGMTTNAIIDPRKIMKPLVDFQPDLILMDVYMPFCNGLELAQVIRQQDAYTGIPIVYLSVEENIDKQLAAMNFGGDDFLTKPIQPEHLVSSLASRTERARVLRSFMHYDSLTGLLNHTKTKEQLGLEIARASRRNSTLACAMIDLDNFKNVNDKYGHSVGDLVLQSLAHFLKQRLRRTDVIGRYGGEEFMVILPDTNGQDAVKVLNKIRIGFSQVRHRSDNEVFYVTFSCGIATFPHYVNMTQISDAADDALYKAKRQGRNMVVLAS